MQGKPYHCRTPYLTTHKGVLCLLNWDIQKMREEFKRMKRLYFKEHPKQCAKCSEFHQRIHLHHKIPLEKGGNNIFKNLIPLCDTCNKEWHNVEDIIPLEQFLQQCILVNNRHK